MLGYPGLEPASSPLQGAKMFKGVLVSGGCTWAPFMVQAVPIHICLLSQATTVHATNAKLRLTVPPIAQRSIVGEWMADGTLFDVSGVDLPVCMSWIQNPPTLSLRCSPNNNSCCVLFEPFCQHKWNPAPTEPPTCPFLASACWQTTGDPEHGKQIVCAWGWVIGAQLLCVVPCGGGVPML